MNPLDWMLAILLTYSVVRAALNGLLREAFTLGGIVVGFLLACWYYRELAPHLSGLITSPPLALFASFIVLLGGTMVVAHIAALILRRGAKTIGLGFMDRLGGAAFGLVRGFLLGTAILTAFTAFLATAPWMKNSLLAPYFLSAAHAVSFVMPADLSNRFHEGVERIKHTTPDWIKSASPSQTR